MKKKVLIIGDDIQVWSGDSDFSVDDAVKNHIKKLRKKLTPANQEFIKNVWGIGYRFTPYEPQKK